MIIMNTIMEQIQIQNERFSRKYALRRDVGYGESPRIPQTRRFVSLRKRDPRVDMYKKKGCEEEEAPLHGMRERNHHE